MYLCFMLNNKYKKNSLLPCVAKPQAVTALVSRIQNKYQSPQQISVFVSK